MDFETIYYVQNGVYVNEISILKGGYLRINLAKKDECGNESHIRRKTKLNKTYKLECM
ncbi:hypothetical protein Lser_V15G29998 [Lactuca serriola]